MRQKKSQKEFVLTKKVSSLVVARNVICTQGGVNNATRDLINTLGGAHRNDVGIAVVIIIKLGQSLQS